MKVERVPKENGPNLDGKLEEEEGEVLTREEDGRIITKEEEEKVDGSLGVAELVAQEGWSQRLRREDRVHALGQLHQRRVHQEVVGKRRKRKENGVARQGGEQRKVRRGKQRRKALVTRR